MTDIDRGGAFAHLYGTWALLDAAERERIAGFVLNKFRGDRALLAPGPQMLQDLTGIATVATLPMWREHGLPEEDGVFDDRGRGTGEVSTTIAVIAYPRVSNLDEFQPLKHLAGVRAGVGPHAGRLSPAPTGSYCPAPSTPAPTCAGCARRAWTRRSRGMPRAAVRCWASAAGCRCWARR